MRTRCSDAADSVRPFFLFAPGAAIPENMLARGSGMSRTPAREALLRPAHAPPSDAWTRRKRYMALTEIAGLPPRREYAGRAAGCDGGTRASRAGKNCRTHIDSATPVFTCGRTVDKSVDGQWIKC